MIESPLDTVALYDKLEKERAENDRLREEIAYLKQKILNMWKEAEEFYLDD